MFFISRKNRAKTFFEPRAAATSGTRCRVRHPPPGTCRPATSYDRKNDLNCEIDIFKNSLARIFFVFALQRKISFRENIHQTRPCEAARRPAPRACNAMYRGAPKNIHKTRAGQTIDTLNYACGVDIFQDFVCFFMRFTLGRWQRGCWHCAQSVRPMISFWRSGEKQKWNSKIMNKCFKNIVNNFKFREKFFAKNQFPKPLAYLAVPLPKRHLPQRARNESARRK